MGKRLLVGCECSQVVTKAFRARGYTAYSCDLQDCYGGYPEWHIKSDILDVVNGDRWDMFICHPPCTYLSNAGAVRLYPGGVLDPDRYKKGLIGKQFFMDCFNAPVFRKCIENPIPSKVFGLPPYSDKIQPYEFGEPYSKATCLWLTNLPGLFRTFFVVDYHSWVYSVRSPQLRAETFPNIANAMAAQWGCYLE